MSGGGGSSDKKTTPTATTPAGGTALPAYANAPVTRTVQPMMPGFQNALADQLAAGFGGMPFDFASMLSGMYQPMQLTSFKEPISQTAANWDKSKNAPIVTGNSALDGLLGGKGKSTASDDKTAGRRLKVGELAGSKFMGRG